MQEDKIKMPLRYMFLHKSGAKPEFIDGEFNSSILIPFNIYGDTISTPNLTGRLNAIVEYAESQLARIVDTKPKYAHTSVVKVITLYAKYEQAKLDAMRSAADERLHQKEFELWFRWFQREYYAAWGAAEARNFDEMARLDKLQYNGRAPF